MIETVTAEDLADGLPEPPADADALAEAAMVLAEHGIDIRLPWNCSLDDLERDQYEAFKRACRAYADNIYAEIGEFAASIADYEAQRHAQARNDILADGYCDEDSVDEADLHRASELTANHIANSIRGALENDTAAKVSALRQALTPLNPTVEELQTLVKSMANNLDGCLKGDDLPSLVLRNKARALLARLDNKVGGR